MDNQEKAMVYDNCLRESDRLQREISKLKSEYAGNIPPDVQQKIDEKTKRIAVLVNRLENLFK